MLQAADVWFGYEAAVPVLRGISLAVVPGAIVGILGPNGSGKTTLLRLLAGTRHPQRGAITLNGAPLGRFSRAALARRMAVVPQETHLAFDYTVAEVAMMGRYPHLGAFEIEGPSDIEVVDEALDATGTLPLKHRPFATLSGGEKQRVVIAAALAQIVRLPGHRSLREGGKAEETDAGFLLLDEPTASLDLAYQLEIAALLKRLRDERHVAIVISTHDLALAATLCERIALIRTGEIVAEGPTAEALTRERIRQVYGVEADIFTHSSGQRIIVPIRRAPNGRPDA
jgi:iron complex transport system ATP-binding protein